MDIVFNFLNSFLAYVSTHPFAFYFLIALLFFVMAGRGYPGMGWPVWSIIGALFANLGLTSFALGFTANLIIMVVTYVVGFAIGDGRRMFWFLRRKQTAEGN